ncbi:hypothetical protein A2U01_0081065, partial [Trifolium medium]|nr:hypothetical protein [Trifolium medium]
MILGSTLLPLAHVLPLLRLALALGLLSCFMFLASRERLE